MKAKILCSLFLISVAAVTTLAQAPIRRVTPRAAPPAAAPAAPAASTAEEKSPEEYGAPTGPIVFDGTNNPVLKFEKAPHDILLRTYAEITGKTLLIAPNVPKVEAISLRSQPGVMLNREEYLRAIEQVLVMHNIALEPAGEKFLRVLPANEIRKLGIRTHLTEPKDGQYDENGRIISQIIQLKSISIEEAKVVLEGFKRGEGQIQLFERTNSILVTDTVENVNRMMEIIRYIDIPIENREETHVRPIKYAKAADIKSRLEEIVAEALKEQQSKSKTVVDPKKSGAPGMVRRDIPGIVRPRFGNRQPQPAQPAVLNNETIETLVSDAERGIIRGKVQIVADERTNILIFLTRPENMKFFDKIIDVLDVEVETTPDVIVNVFRLEYATAEDVAKMLNDLIGNNDKKANDQDKANAKNRKDNKNTKGGSSSLAAAANRSKQTTAKTQTSDDTKAKLGELSKDNVTILSDERSNAIIVMASPADMLSIKSIIDQMDIQLSQVVIETVIVSVSFFDSQETGMDWVQRAMLGWTGKADAGRPPTFSFATGGGGGSGTPQVTHNLATTDSLNAISGGGANAWLTFYDLNMDLVLKAVQTDSRARVMSSPRITTMDNKEAKLESTERIYWKEGTTHYNDSDNYSDNIKSEDVGIKLTVTPRINKKGYITLTIQQEIQSNNGYKDVTGSGSQFPQLVTRTMGADVAVQSGETVVLGGLAQNSLSKKTTKVPILGSIPLLGWLFRSEYDENTRTEIIVFLTPRVIDTPAQMEDDARKIKASIDTDGVWDSSWSNSRLADPLPEKKAQHIRENAEQTVAPANYPGTGYLTPLNTEEQLKDLPEDHPLKKADEDATETGNESYVHFSDVDSKIQNRVSGFFSQETSTAIANPTNAPALTPEN